jgi:hypothetical protein
MAKRMTKTEMNGLFWLAVIGLPIYWISQLGESVGWVPLIIIVVAIVLLYLWRQSTKSKARREALMRKYRDSEIVESLMNETFWQGQTAGQLVDSIGNPHDIDQKILKTKKKEVWKYNHQGGNRYGLRITLDNDIVVGWDQKT